MSIKIIGDSTMDLSPEVQKKLGISCVPFTVEFGETPRKDTTFSNDELFDYNKTHKDICKTSAVNVGEVEEFYNRFNKDDDLIYFSISSKLSSGCQNALIAADDNPKIHVVDSESFSLGIALMAIKAKEMVDEGKTVDEILNVIEDYKKNTVASLIIDDLSFMARGGRISKAVALAAGALRIHPILSTKDGTFFVFKKLIGKTNKLGKKYVESVLEGQEDIDYSLALVGYTSEIDEGVTTIVEELKAKGFERVEISRTNSTNAVHGGPNVYGIAFCASNKGKKHRSYIDRFASMLNRKAAEKAIADELNKYYKD